MVTFQVLQNGRIQKFRACFVKKSCMEELFNPEIIVINRITRDPKYENHKKSRFLEVTVS